MVKNHLRTDIIIRTGFQKYLFSVNDLLIKTGNVFTDKKNYVLGFD